MNWLFVIFIGIIAITLLYILYTSLINSTKTNLVGRTGNVIMFHGNGVYTININDCGVMKCIRVISKIKNNSIPLHESVLIIDKVNEQYFIA